MRWRFLPAAVLRCLGLVGGERFAGVPNAVLRNFAAEVGKIGKRLAAQRARLDVDIFIAHHTPRGEARGSAAPTVRQPVAQLAPPVVGHGKQILGGHQSDVSGENHSFYRSAWFAIHSSRMLNDLRTLRGLSKIVNVALAIPKQEGFLNPRADQGDIPAALAT